MKAMCSTQGVEKKDQKGSKMAKRGLKGAEKGSFTVKFQPFARNKMCPNFYE